MGNARVGGRWVEASFVWDAGALRLMKASHDPPKPNDERKALEIQFAVTSQGSLIVQQLRAERRWEARFPGEPPSSPRNLTPRSC